MGFRSVNFYLLILFTTATFLSLLGIVSLSSLDIAAYACLFWGISFFYSSYLKQYQTRIALSSALFLIGTILFVFTQFEILNFGAVFFPSALIVIGLSVLISNLITKVNTLSILFSVLSLFAGTWILISRSTATVELFLSAAYALIKNYWVVIIFLVIIIFLVAVNFKKRYDDQN